MALPFHAPASLDPSFTISRPLTEADINGMARLYYDSFMETKKTIVSFVRWGIPIGYETTFDEWTGNDSAPGGLGGVVRPSTAKLPRGADPALFKSFFTMISRMSEKWYTKEMLAPKYHRRGAAKALMEPILAIADSVSLPCYLESTPTARPLYEKFGFQTVDVHDFDVSVLAGGRMEGTTSTFIMIREPRPSHGM
ncbi:acyl-CoA N-acyltransferase [Xylaria nigripes]|nr:acyl-CoA N-acyltransferase [Xylaria nigripes]